VRRTAGLAAPPEQRAYRSLGLGSVTHRAHGVDPGGHHADPFDSFGYDAEPQDADRSDGDGSGGHRSAAAGHHADGELAESVVAGAIGALADDPNAFGRTPIGKFFECWDAGDNRIRATFRQQRRCRRVVLRRFDEQ